MNRRDWNWSAQQRWTVLLIATLAVLQFAVAPRAATATFEFPWFTIDGGGQTSSTGSLAVSGTVGQQDTGFSCGGQFTLEGGFWASESIGLPELKILRAGSSFAISWPMKFAGFTLQRTPALSIPGSWVNVTTPAVVVGDRFTLTESFAAGNQFYRLSK